MHIIFENNMENTITEFKDDRPAYIISGISHELAGLAIFSVLPIFVSALISEGGFTNSQGGYVASADIVGISISNLFAYFWINRVSWAKASRFLLSSLISLNLVCMFLTSFEQIVVVRLLCGLLEGSLFSLAIAMLARTSRPDRNFAFTFCTSLLTGALNIYLMSFLVNIFGIRGVFIDLILFSIVPLFLWRHVLPDTAMEGASDNVEPSDKVGASTLVLSIVLLANLIYFIGQGGLWSYVKEIVAQAGISESDIKSGLSISLIAGMIGAGLASWLDIKVGRVVPLAVAIIMAIGSVYLLDGEVTYVIFVIAACLYNFGSNLGHPYLFGYLASIDPKRKFVVISGAMQTGGMGLGPAIAAYFIVGENLDPVLSLSYFAFIGALVLFVPIMLLIRGQNLRE